MSKIKNTTTILTQYLGKELRSNELDAEYVSFLLEYVFGEGIHANIDGFIEFAKTDDDIFEGNIKGTLAHDVRGALSNDKLMIPRVSEYGKFSKAN